ncbi:nicotinate-nucleotide-dimethylbenzimidazole phosphoribosyltransferase [Sinobacterium caligoides]|uniref:Nicotinate-nucleotide--dimethylbenzimidazole phosphoribosyltransferase n=1 Tax=Sinobacterium caligoides TaxID=933926 RepID=A0A3N2DZT0_9GAMM|nr:nicotinate-nucleotide--dimethylbenzimidazole phosphoribosyltransferase [Sinobacterium caligoides]ROS05344.1 nicotinate-nucleotide-dimethylbenzimidazole phosphoribosyltransferase [Sinobacterium caligoides]
MSAWYLAAAKQLDQEARQEALTRQSVLTKPPGSLGRLEAVAVALAAMQGCEQPSLNLPYIAIFAADHGIAKQGVSAFPQVVTGEMIRNFAAGGAAITVMAKQMGATFTVLNMGTAFPVEPLPSVRSLNIKPGTDDFSKQPAMSDQELMSCLQAAADFIDEIDADLFIGGEMGIANTTSASALAAVMLGEQAEALVGPGTGVSSDVVMHKAQVIDAAIALHGVRREQPMALLACLGGLEIAGLVGAYIRCAQRGLPVLVDGFIATVAALMAVAINPSIRGWLLFGHSSAEPGHRKVLAALEAEAILQLDMRLGEGSGAAVAYSVVQSALALHRGMASFADAGVSGADEV